MSGSKKTNNSSLMFQMQQADEAKAKEAQRQARLDQGKVAIDAIYGTGKRNVGEAAVNSAFDNGQFGDSFFNKFRDSITGYYMPELDKQYNEAKSDLTFNLARTGNLNSSAAASKQGELEYQKALQGAQIANNADQQTAGLRTQVAQQKKSLIDQLYATEDPTMASNLAQTSANGLQLQNPTLTPAAAFFTPALTAIGSGVAAYTSPYGQSGGGRNNNGPVVASATSSSGKPYYGS